MMSTKALRSSDSASARADLGVVERRDVAVDDQVGRVVGRLQLAVGLRQLRLNVLHQRHGQVERERHVELAGDEGQHAGRAVGDDAPVDGIDVGVPLAPIVGVAHELDRLVALELDELERTRADRLGAHVGRRHVAGIDRVVAGGEQRDERSLRPAEVERHLVVAVGRHLLQVVPPDLARVLAKAVRALVLQLVQGADDVLGRERLAVVPRHVVAQLEGELGLGLVPGPAGGELGLDGVHGIELLVLVVEHEVVVDGHERHRRRDGRLLVDRGAGRVVPEIHAQRAALLLGERRRGGDQHGDGSGRADTFRRLSMVSSQSTDARLALFREPTFRARSACHKSGPNAASASTPTPCSPCGGSTRRESLYLPRNLGALCGRDFTAMLGRERLAACGRRAQP